jgi:protein involved in polysaccharide export with SLBB domain
MQIQVSLMIQGALEFPPTAQRINQSGNIGLPLLQSVDVGNMDMEEVENMITRMYSEYYRDPLVNVEFVGALGDASTSPWGYVNIRGNVNNPGPVAMPPTRIFTVSEALKRAGGVSASAKKGAIRIFRPVPEEDSVELIRVDLDDLGRKGQTAEDVTLLAGDVVYIPERVW